jgi:PhoPQ-activated pathogenicity-related protein
MAPRLLPAALAAATAATAAASPLWDYVHSPNPSYGWYDTGVVIESSFDNITKAGGWKAHLLNLTSQAWLTPADFVGSIGHVWTHNLVVVVPETINYKAAGMLYITGNGNDGAPNQAPSADDEDLLVCASLAVTVGAVCSVLYQVPNQPVVFAADPARKARSEDALVAWTWDRYASGADPRPEAIAYFAMARAGVTALDATEAFILNKTGATIAKWGVAGASKRGATTWLVGAAAHERLFGIIPIVFDALNFKDTLQHMWRTLGNWTCVGEGGGWGWAVLSSSCGGGCSLTHSPRHTSTHAPSPPCHPHARRFAFTDYIDAGVTSHLNDGTGYLDRLAAQVDPLAYNANLSLIPKLIVDSTGDEFFQPQVRACARRAGGGFGGPAGR